MGTRRVLPLSNAERCRRFGRFRFKAAGTHQNPERILILDGWAEQNICFIECPLLRDKFGRRRVNIHRDAVESFLALWMRWDKAGLLPLIERWNGSYVPRFKRTSGTLDERIAKCRTRGLASVSNHTWGTAFDIDAHRYPLGRVVPEDAPIRELVPYARELGWFWGGDFRRRPDGMHFEYVGEP